MGASRTPEVVTIHIDGLDEQLVLPEQLQLGLAGVAAVEGERRLILAVFEDALQAFRRYAAASDTRGRNLFREAEEWFMEGDAGAVLSFEYVSETLGLDAEQVRSALRRWRDRSRHRARPESVTTLAFRATPPRLKKASGE
jgi:hypothetical protein